MYIVFDGRLVNVNAVSEFVAIKQNDEYKIMAFRMDGSFMASESFADATKATERFGTISKKLIGE